jgi:thymidylate kinase
VLVIVEGADRAGKTTLAKEISRRLGFRYTHHPEPDGAEQYFRFLLEIGSGPVVCDRFHFSEMVYAPFLRRKSCLTDLDRLALERMIRRRGGMLILLDPPFEIIERRTLGEPTFLPDGINRQVHAAFPVYLERINVPWERITAVGPEPAKRLFHELELNAKAYRVRLEQADKVCRGIGTVLGRRFVLVGEDSKSPPGLPFTKGGTATFLLDALTAAGVHENKVYAVNMKDLTAEEVDFLQKDGKVMWVPLGVRAGRRLKELGRKGPCHQLPHPAAVRRFHWGRREELFIGGLRRAWKRFWREVR